VKLISDKKEFDTSSFPPLGNHRGDFFCLKFWEFPRLA
jgi:hypothetical protein